ncbi:ribosomal protein S18-alanine N-acetyltransferase [Vibrio sp. JC009]|uniref:ribosomal protein S18-alanine N-acetyltransferase n=1 Tax=Vibrio sp. JC009 TaxID=2912314 RepID=UPI0023AF0880|nr:ribosomal protein S18-alanine N-acetyltransferase [Vibrio sp. JC009]WED21233.1 ribosomal protein S18-alanine N-acetyltransferase [Vibrio sp. JC009]
MTHKLIPMQQAHLPQVWQIEKLAHTHPWSQSLINDLSSRGGCHHVLVDNRDNVLGYFYAQNIVGEVTLLNIAVNPEKQGQGIGRELLDGFLEYCESQKAESAWLEVRESNARAIALYDSAGFNEVDRRRDYYPAKNGKEDAIIMSYLFFPG